MVTQVVSTNVGGTATVRTLASSDDLLILQNATLYATEAGLPVLAEGFNDVFVEGTILSVNGGIRIGNTDQPVDTSYGRNVTVAIGERGTISAGTSGIAINARGADVRNAGTIQANIGLTSGFFSDPEPAFFSLMNTGSILGDMAGIRMLDLNGASLTNTGTISQSGTGATDSSSQIGPNNGAVVLDGTEIVLTNLGTIIAGGRDAYGIAVYSSGAVITNSGLVQSNSLNIARAAVDLITEIDGIARLVNTATGRIVGALTAVDGNAGEETVINAGEIVGNVRLNAGNDRFDGRGGSVIGTLDAGDGDDRIISGIADDSVFGGSGSDTLLGTEGDDELFGGIGTDQLFGGIGDDTLNGDAQNDLLNGRHGDDALFGGSGNDTLIGGAGDDSLRGGIGLDRMTGGAGADVFVFRTGETGATGATADRITDFQAGVDDLDLAALRPAGLTFIGSAAFSNTAGEVRYQAGSGTVSIDIDGNGVADAVIVLENRQGLNAADFILA